MFVGPNMFIQEKRGGYPGAAETLGESSSGSRGLVLARFFRAVTRRQGLAKASLGATALIAVVLLQMNGCNHAPDPDETIRHAYSWYAKALKRGENPLARKAWEMAPFATNALLQSIGNRREEPGDHPFARSRRFDGRLHVEDLVVSGKIARARITVAGHAIGVHQLAVCLAREGSVWKIDDVKLLDDL
ncbi:MAG: hypothetical protein ABI839_01090 [Verrucomicrobiota bacterium]